MATRKFETEKRRLKIIEQGADGGLSSPGIGTPKSKVFDLSGTRVPQKVTKRTPKAGKAGKRIPLESEAGKRIAEEALDTLSRLPLPVTSTQEEVTDPILSAFAFAFGKRFPDQIPKVKPSKRRHRS